MKGEKQSVRGRRDLPMGSLSGSEDGSDTSLTPEERDVLNAKMFLMNQTEPGVPCLYDHLANLIAQVLDDDIDTVDIVTRFEDISRNIKRERLDLEQMPIRTHVPSSPSENIAMVQWSLLKKRMHVAKGEMDNLLGNMKMTEFPDIMKQAAYFEQAGVGLPREEFVRISLALTHLMDSNTSIKGVRFWGKIFGIGKNYFIAETELAEQNNEDEVSVTNTQTENDTNNDELPSGLQGEFSNLLDDTMPDDLKPLYKPPPKIPCEPAGTGLNKKVYFVTSEPGLPWVRLPHVTPAQIQVARKIRKFFTGELDAQVVSFPPFPGLEKNFLRAQIARITASTHVSPLGYFRFDDEPEEEELGEEAESGRGNVIHDVEYEGMSIKDLADGNLQAWVHHSQAILPQGRTSWWNPTQPKETFHEGEEAEDEEEERTEPDEPEPETGPPLLTPLAEDENVGNSPPWIACTSSKLIPEYSVAVLQSNVWVGAVVFAAQKGKIFENMYIGWGIKNQEKHFEPVLPDLPMGEFPSGPEITEADDPTPEEEAAVRTALHEKQLEAEFEQNVNDDDDDDIIDEGAGGFGED